MYCCSCFILSFPFRLWAVVEHPVFFCCHTVSFFILRPILPLCLHGCFSPDLESKDPCVYRDLLPLFQLHHPISQ